MSCTAKSTMVCEVVIPDQFICPLTLECMVTPMMTRSGHSFERSAIVAWLKKNGSHPLTRQRMGLRDLVPHVKLQSDIVAWKCAHGNLLLDDTDSETEDCSEEGDLLCINGAEFDKFMSDEKQRQAAPSVRRSSLVERRNDNKRRFVWGGRKES